MNSDLVYLCNVHPNGTVYYDINFICMFDMNSIQLDSFSMGTNKNSKNIPISHDIIFNEKRKFERKKKEEESEE